MRMAEDAAAVEIYLNGCFAKPDSDTALLTEAMKYSLLAPGKRVRPFLVFEFCRMFGGSLCAALPFAAAIEMVHAFSLIHDDLPCMDNDDMRRGRPTNHKKFGEATALLAGDALLIAAFGAAAENPELPPQRVCRAVSLLSHYAGAYGMTGGQIMDMQGESGGIDSLDKLRKLHSLKTGALIRSAAALGCIAAVSAGSREAKSADMYAENIGIAFQIKDDLLDVYGDAGKLGKNTGRDASDGKTTYLTFMSREEAEAALKDYTEKAVRAISGYGNNEILSDFALWLREREN